jgi:hypothetical protein
LTSYNIRVDFNQLNGLFDPEAISATTAFYFYFEFFYDSLAVEERFETLVYDTGSLLASAGGNLGLMLGFSCLSVLMAALDCLHDCFQKYYHTNKT